MKPAVLQKQLEKYIYNTDNKKGTVVWNPV